MSKRRVVVTGIGIISPVGNNLKDNWKNISEGVSGISKITYFDTEGFPCNVAGEANDFNIEDYMSQKEARKMDRFIQIGMAAGIDAFADSGLEVTEAWLTSSVTIFCA